MARPGGFLYADDDTLVGVTLALSRIDREAKKEWAKAMRGAGSRYWRQAVASAKSQPQDKVFGAANVRWSMGGKGTATVKIRPLSGFPDDTPGDGIGVDPRAPWQVIDFGNKRSRRTAQRGPYRRRTKGTAGTVDAHPFDLPVRSLPRHVPTGRIVWGSVDGLGRYMGAMALRTVADLVRDAAGVTDG